MRRRATRWLAALVLAVVLGLGMLGSSGRPSIAHGEDDPTPTPTQTQGGTNGQPGGGGGGGP